MGTPLLEYFEGPWSRKILMMRFLYDKIWHSYHVIELILENWWSIVSKNKGQSWSKNVNENSRFIWWSVDELVFFGRLIKMGNK